MRTSCFIILILLAFTAQSQVMFQFKNDSVFAFEYADGDEFNTPSINTSKWSVGLPWSRVIMSQDLAFSPKNVVQQNGLINFIANKEDSLYQLGMYEVDSSFLKKEKMSLNAKNEFLTRYSVGCIVSKNKYQYGIHEIRFKVEEGQGVWPAFWFYGGNKNEEIDIFELKDERNDDIHVDTHCPEGCDKGYKNKIGLNTNWGGWMPLTGYLHDGFNVMALEWRKDELIWFINGYPLAYFKGNFDNPMNLYLNTSVAKDGGAFKPGPNEKTKWPNTYSVDYYRYWKPVSAQKQLALKKDDAYAISSQFKTTYSIKPAKKRGLMFKKSKLNPLEGNITVIQSADYKVMLAALGKFKNTGLKIKIEGNNTKQTYSYDPNVEEAFIDVNKSDTQLIITFTTESSTLTQTLNLQ